MAGRRFTLAITAIALLVGVASTAWSESRGNPPLGTLPWWWWRCDPYYYVFWQKDGSPTWPQDGQEVLRGPHYLNREPGCRRYRCVQRGICVSKLFLSVFLGCGTDN